MNLDDKRFVRLGIVHLRKFPLVMWCSSCQQDVPGVMSLENASKICCARCNSELSSGAAVGTPTQDLNLDDLAADTDELEQSDHQPREVAPQETNAVDAHPPVELEDWEFEEDLRSVERLMRSLRASGVLDPDADSSTHNVDAAHDSLAGTHSDDTKDRPAKPEHRTTRPLISFVAWSMLSLGLMAFACGSVLLGWSFVEGRANLWTLGLPLTLGGQAFLLIGLLFQLENLWESNRETTSTLNELDEQLDDLRHATSLLGTTHSSPAQSFYAHMAEGASPKMLLADLKGQLDMLATKIGK